MEASNTEVSIPQKNEDKPQLGRAEIAVGTNKVAVSWAEFKPESQERADSNKAVIFLPGWPWQAKAKIVWEQPRRLAQEFGLSTYAIDTRVNKITRDALSIEAEALHVFIRRANLSEVTIFGHSEGAIKAANLAVLLEKENPKITINGIILANPMGMYSQRFIRQLAPGFAMDTFIVDPQEANPKTPFTLKQGMQLLGGFASGLGRDIKAAKLRYPWLLKQQMSAMMRIQHSFSQIEAPVIVLATERDLMSSYKKYLPPEEIKQRMPPSKTEEELRGEISSLNKWENLSEEERNKVYGSDKAAFVEDYLSKYRTKEEMVGAARARAAYLREQRLPKTRELRVLVATKCSSHAGFFKRPDEVAHVVSKIFRRLQRRTGIPSL